MDSMTCERLISLSFEIEGLAMLMRERADCTPDEVVALLRGKVAEINSILEVADGGVVNMEKTPEMVEPEAHVECEACEDVMNASHQVAAERIDERFARESARDIRHAFTLNDRFRFRRELFSNSEAKMADALEVIDSMATLGDAEDYFYNDLVWDRENADVKDFMAIVARHFGNVR